MFPASLGGRQSHWWRFGGFGVSGVPAWDDGREGALHDVQEQERGGPQRQPGEGKVSPILLLYRFSALEVDAPPKTPRLSVTHAHGAPEHPTTSIA